MLLKKEEIKSFYLYSPTDHLTLFNVCIDVFAGDVEIGLMERNGQLEVEIIQARGLIMKPGSKGPPGDSSSDRT